MMTTMGWLRRCGIIAAMILTACASAPEGASTRRTTSLGTLEGTADASTGTLSWKGVPYAAPPVGERRWRAPAPAAPWPGVRPARDFGPACVQTGRLYGPGRNNRYDETIGQTLGQPLGSEDCLTLNVWAPATPAARPRPVIVWVHGGSNITGYTADPVYDGARLARAADAVVVSVNYRLGIFGFLNLAALKGGTREEDSGNFALLDLVQALEVVQREVGAFGGDPGRVTLMGQSAGAVNVYALLTSPMVAARSTPLFHRVVALSGGISSAATLPAGAFPVILPPATWAARGQALADAANAPTAAALRALPAERLLEVVRTQLAPRGMAASNPIADGWVVAADPIAAIRAGRAVRVPVLAGNTRDETRLFPTFLALRPDLGGVSGRLLDDAAVFALAHRHDPEAPPATRVEDWIPPAYLPVTALGTGFFARTAHLDHIWFLAIRDDVLDALTSAGHPVWAYRFDWDDLPPPFDALYGAAHTFDLPFLFGNFGPSLYANISFTRANAPGRLALSSMMMASLAAFVQGGDPNAGAPVAPWPAWPQLRVFDADATTARATVSAR